MTQNGYGIGNRQYWLANGSRATVGQGQSGESDKTHNLAQSGKLQSGNRAVGPNLANRARQAIVKVGQIKQPGNRANQTIGQGKSNKLPNWEGARLVTWPALPDFSRCQTCQIAHFARLRRCKCARLPAARLGQIAICQSGQSGNRAHDPHDCL